MFLEDPINRIILIVVLFFLYFIPALTACARHHQNALSIFLTNLFFGWTAIGWIVALIWSASANVTPPKLPQSTNLSPTEPQNSTARFR